MHIAVVGAGISGMTLAHTLLRRSNPEQVAVTVVERSSRAGGVVRSERIGDFLCEHGPNGFLDGAAETMALVDELGIRDRLVRSSDRARRRFVYRDGRLRALPSGPTSFLTSDVLSLRGRLRIALEPLVRSRSQADESVHAFVSRRFGPEAADVLADALTTGVFGGGARELSIRACLPQIWQLEADYGGIVRGLIRRRRAPRGPAPSEGDRGGAGAGLGRLTSFAEGIEELLRALARSVGPRLRTGTSVERLEPVAPDGTWKLHTSDGGVLAADHVVLAIGADRAARLADPVDAQLAGDLRAISWAPIGILCLGFSRSTPGAEFDGFGFLAPRGEGLRILGAVWDSSIFPGRAPTEHVLVRVLVGGGRDPAAAELDDEALIALARADLRTACRLDASPRFARVIRQVPGLPQYRLGHVARLERITARVNTLPGLSLIGNSYRGLALNACIAEARSMAESLLSAGAPLAAPGGARAIRPGL